MFGVFIDRPRYIRTQPCGSKILCKTYFHDAHRLVAVTTSRLFQYILCRELIQRTKEDMDNNTFLVQLIHYRFFFIK